MLDVQLLNLHRVAPELHLCIAGILIMILDPFLGPTQKRWLGWLAAALRAGSGDHAVAGQAPVARSVAIA